MPFLHWYILLYFERVDRLENREPLSDRMNSDVLERFVVEMNQNFSRYSVLCVAVHQPRPEAEASEIEIPLICAS